MLDSQFEELKDFLNKTATELFKPFETLPFCERKVDFEKQIKKLFPDLDNFTSLIQMYSRFETKKQYYESEVKKLKEDFNGLRLAFSKLYTAKGFLDCISKA